MRDSVDKLVDLAMARVRERESLAPRECEGGGERSGCCGNCTSSRESQATHAPQVQAAVGAEVVIASDHGGFELKQQIVAHLTKRGIAVLDLGPSEATPCDYPDQALKVAVRVAQAGARCGIVVDGVGIGSAMAAGKVPGVRPATCFDTFSARNARGHNDANVMCLGGRVLGSLVVLEMVDLFLDTRFEGGRHQKRVDKIMAIERTFLKAGAGVEAFA